jgi:glucan phosphorylase
MSSTGWFQRAHSVAGVVFAYFSAEFGLTECIPNYAGGLGILAGDHLKSARDAGLPLVGVGLLYKRGYFQQYVNADDWQQETFPVNDFYMLPRRDGWVGNWVGRSRNDLIPCPSEGQPYPTGATALTLDGALNPRSCRVTERSLEAEVA